MNDEEIQALIDDGSLIADGEDEEGPVYRWNTDKLSVLHPSIYDAIMTDISMTLLALEDKGFIDLEWDESQMDFVVALRPGVTLPE